MKNRTAIPKMSRKQAMILWKTLSPEEKANFNKMFVEMNAGKLMISEVKIDDEEKIRGVTLDPKDKPGTPDKPFYKHFILPPERK